MLPLQDFFDDIADFRRIKEQKREKTKQLFQEASYRRTFRRRY